MAIPNVVGAEYISARQALRDFAEGLGESELLAGFEDDNPLPRSFVLTLDDINAQTQVIARINTPEMKALGAEKTRDDADLTELLISIGRGVRITAVALIALFGMLSVIIIMNAIKLTLNARRSEIGIMKYIGATDRFIKTPFVLEGVFIGIFGAAAAALLSMFGYGALLNLIYTRIPVIETLMRFRSAGDIFAVITPIVVIVGAAIGAAGSLMSVRRYLDV
jgi:cell division transport system permease protein